MGLSSQWNLGQYIIFTPYVSANLHNFLGENADLRLKGSEVLLIECLVKTINKLWHRVFTELKMVSFITNKF